MEDSKLPAQSSLVTWSNQSVSSKYSKGSTVNPAVAIALAEAEEAKAKVKYAEKEMQIKMQKARLDAERACLEAQLAVLDVEREAAVAVAKAEALSTALSSDKVSSRKSSSQRASGSHATTRRTKEYVQEQARLQANKQLDTPVFSEVRWPLPPPTESFQEKKPKLPPYGLEAPDLGEAFKRGEVSENVIDNQAHILDKQSEEAVRNAPYADKYHPRLPQSVKPSPSVKNRQDTYFAHVRPPDDLSHLPVHAHLNSNMQSQDMAINAHSYPQIKSCAPTPPHVRFHTSTPYTNIDANRNMSDLVRFMARREIVSTGLLQFDDHPENYRSWKASFFTATKDLNLTAKEEMDLLVKWLGTDSREQVKRIRAVHVANPDRGLLMIWERLDDCFGAPEVVESSLLRRLETFPKISNKEWKKLRELGDLLMELLVAKSEGVLLGLAYLDTARGIASIVQKLPFNLQDKWMTLGYTFKQQHRVPFPPFSVLVNFVVEQARMRNDPSFALPLQADHLRPEHPRNTNRASISVHKTDVSPQSSLTGETQGAKMDLTRFCPIHKKPHPFNKCRGFREKSIEDRKAFLKQNGICFKCVSSTTHFARNCGKVVKCTECGSEAHHSLLHPKPVDKPAKAQTLTKEYGGEKKDSSEDDVSTKCTEVCGSDLSGKTCSKICLVSVFPSGQREKAIRVYAIIDDQSNRSLVRSKFFDVFNVDCDSSSYYLKTCTGVSQKTGRRAHGFQVASVDGRVIHSLPTLIECDDIPDDRSEIPTPQVALHHPHLKDIAGQIPEIDPDAPIMMLLGRDIIKVHKVMKHINGPREAPYALKLDLGWVIVGNVCLGKVHKPDRVNVLFTNTLDSGRQSLFIPCPNTYHIKENVCDKPSGLLATAVVMKPEWEGEHHVEWDVFKRTKDDDKLALSVEDLTFLRIMKEGFYKDERNSWVSPLPFKPQRRRLPNNKTQALDRFRSLQRSFSKKPIMKEHFFAFMGKILAKGHAEIAPPLKQHDECWYLPLFGVYHPKKPDQIRVVFDSSCQYNGVSLNDVLLKGPDLNNGLLGVLLRFRKEVVAFTTDVQQMFHCFLVKPEDRNFLRFFWYEDNDPEKSVIEYRMKVHIFGNSPSPAVAIYGLRQAAKEAESEFGVDVGRFVERDFYVDDGLRSLPSAAAAIDLLKRTQAALAHSNLKLHKIASNSKEVMDAFPLEEQASDLRIMDLGKVAVPVQRTLGVNWNLLTDTFTFQLSCDTKPFTRRGVLSTVNGLYDPFGFAAPVVIRGKALIRELTTETCDWDAPLPPGKMGPWLQWKDSLQHLQHLQIPRHYTKGFSSEASQRELCIFADASVLAIAAVAYLRSSSPDGNCKISFILGKAKLAPRPELTIPRLELCSAVLAVQMAELIMSEMDTEFDNVNFFSDSRVVLGYIHNEKRRFHVFVNNRVLRIRRSTHPRQWHYVASDQNPADHATRSVPAAYLKDTTWFTGPPFLSCPNQTYFSSGPFDLVDPMTDVEVQPEVSAFVTLTKDSQLGSERFKRFSNWKELVHAIACLIHIVQTYKAELVKDGKVCKGWHCCSTPYSVDELSQAKNAIIRAVQQEVFAEEFRCIKDNKNIPKSSPLFTLNPLIDENGLMRVGGRMSRVVTGFDESNPIIIPRRHHIAILIVRHYHEQSQHQGRHFTEGAIRMAGFWIVGAKRCICSLIFGCVICRKLRGRSETQKMADLPMDRVNTEPPFTYVGTDVFGPWTISARRTRGGLANSKRWAVLFTCLTIRAVHIEVLESMDTSCFINALRRFFAIRGPVKQIRSDRGTNFVGACRELDIPSNLDETKVIRFLAEQGCSWIFNPPHASHMGGVWERMIGITRKILDSMMLQLGPSRITHEVLTTFMAEATAIINSRPLVPVSMDPEDPRILAPSTLLTHKYGPCPCPPGEFDHADLYRKQWKQVQNMASTFWDRWRKQYLSTLQPRKKWQMKRQDVTEGSVVLMKDHHTKRNQWPLGRITRVFPSADGRVRKVEIKVMDKEEPKLFIRPITEVVMLIPSD